MLITFIQQYYNKRSFIHYYNLYIYFLQNLAHSVLLHNMQHPNLFGNDEQFEKFINSHQKVEPTPTSEEVTILEDQYSEQIKIFYQLKFTLESRSDIMHYLKSDKIYHMLYGIIGLQQLITFFHPQVFQYIYFLQLDYIQKILKRIQEHGQNHPHLLYELVLVFKNTMLRGNSNLMELILNDNVNIIGLLSSQYIPIVQNVVDFIKISMDSDHSFYQILLPPIIKQNILNPRISENGLLVFAYLLFHQELASPNQIKQSLIFIIQTLSSINLNFKVAQFSFKALFKYQASLQQLNKQTSQKLIKKILSLITTDFIQCQNSSNIKQQIYKQDQQDKNTVKQDLIFYGISNIYKLLQIHNNCEYFIKIDGVKIFNKTLFSENAQTRQLICQFIGEIMCNYEFPNIQSLFPDINIYFRLQQMFKTDTDQIKLSIGNIFFSFTRISNLALPYQLLKFNNVIGYFASLLQGQQKKILLALINIEEILILGDKFKQNNENYFIEQIKLNGSLKKIKKLASHLNKDIADQAIFIIYDILFKGRSIVEQAFDFEDQLNMNNPAGLYEDLYGQMGNSLEADEDILGESEDENEFDDMNAGIDSSTVELDESESQMDEFQDDIDGY